MNCLSFRRQLLIDPQYWNADLKAHAEQCATCARARERALAFEASLYNALLMDQRDDAGDACEQEREDNADTDPPSSLRLVNSL